MRVRVLAGVFPSLFGLCPPMEIVCLKLVAPALTHVSLALLAFSVLSYMHIILKSYKINSITATLVHFRKKTGRVVQRGSTAEGLKA